MTKEKTNNTPLSKEDYEELFKKRTYFFRVLFPIIAIASFLYISLPVISVINETESIALFFLLIATAIFTLLPAAIYMLLGLWIYKKKSKVGVILLVIITLISFLLTIQGGGIVGLLNLFAFIVSLRLIKDTSEYKKLIKSQS